MIEIHTIQKTECPCCHTELEIHLGNGIITAVIAEECAKECDHDWIPYDRCDNCKGEFYQKPIVDQNLCGGYKMFCSHKCSKEYRRLNDQ